MKFLSFLTRLTPAARRARAAQAELDLQQREQAIAQKKEILDGQEAELKAAQDLVAEKLNLAQAWRPFAKRRELTKGQRRALQEGMSDTMHSAIEQIFKELLRQLSNKVVMTTNDEERKQAMYMAAGLNLGMQSLKEKIAEIDRSEARKAEQQRKERAMSPESGPRRGVDHLYDNPRI